MTCPTCGAAVAEGARFCSSCGHALVSRADERRVATVLFADLVGFTSLSETRDPEEVKNLVDSCFERLVQDVTTFGGKVDKIIGDAILALFGAPVAHEDDAERAVRAALRMQDTVSSYCADTGAEIQLRVGVNTGEVLVGSLRAGDEYTAMGDVVNTAQRLQSTATPGAVVVGPATYAATHDVIEYQPLGLIAAKGREEPVDTWQALASLLPPGYRPRRVQAPFVGRDAELGILGGAIDAAVTRGRAHLVLLLGDAGVGKSRLATEVANHACGTHHAHVYEGRCVPYGEANVWWPVAEALRQACGIAADDGGVAVQERCVEAVANALQAAPEGDEVRRVVNGLVHLMGFESPLDKIDAQRAREEAHRSVLSFIEGSARQRPVVVVLSDLHWADDVVLDMIDALADRLSRSRFVLVATARQALNERWRMPTGRHNNIVVNLDPLDRTATGALLESLAGDIGAELRDELLDRSEGNPFFLEELVALVAEGEDGAPDGSPSPRQVSALPDTLRGLVSARIDGLSADERGTLEDASVWGRSGPVEALERMASEVRSVEDIGPILAGLVDKDIVVVDGRRWSFRSDLLREVAYGTMTKADRARRHFGIGHFLERYTDLKKDDVGVRIGDVIAYHYAAAAELSRDIGVGDWVPANVSERALGWLEKAADHAEQAQMPLVADRLFAQALDLVDPHDELRRARLLLGRARAVAATRDLDLARGLAESATALAEANGDRAIVARGYLVLGDVQQKSGDRDAAVATFDAAIEMFRHLGDRAGMAEALRQRGMTHLFHGDNRQAEASISAAHELFHELDDRRGEAWALQNLAWISYVAGRADEAEGRLTESADLFRAIGDRGGLAWAEGLLGFVRYHQGRFEDAERLAARVVGDARERGDKWGEGMMLMLTAAVRLWSGRAEAAVDVAEQGLALFRSIGDVFGQSQGSGVLGRALITSGRVDDGLQVLHQALEQYLGADGFDEQVGAVAAMLALAAIQIGDVTSATAALEHLPDETDGGLGSIEIRVAVGLVAIQEGDGARAHEVLHAVTQGQGARSGFAFAALAMAAAASGRGDEVPALAAEVAAMPNSTYSDRTTASLAVQLARAASGDERAIDGFTDLVATVDETEDRCSQAIVRVAEALALQALGQPTAEWALEEAERRLDEIDITAAGWRTAFRTVLAADKATAGA